MGFGSKIGQGVGGLIILLMGLAGGGLIALSPDIAMPLVVLLLPGLLLLVLDRTPGCAAARAVLLFQAASCVHPVMDAWYRCAGIDGCMGYLAEWPTVLRAWLAAAGAWVLIQILPLGLKVLGDHRLRVRREALVTRRKALTDEWGLEDRSPE
ncbi:MAG TPA: hypothetical protein VFG12_10425 [Rhodopila sp.]|jgi:hypothetical protein|nr:hypothetical protein [Rhodopila sp.]